VSLRARLLILVAGVSLGVAVASVIAVRLVAESRFRTFVRSTDIARARVLAPLVAEAYQEAGSWEGVEEAIAMLPMARGMPMMGGAGRGGQRARLAVPAGGERLVVAGADGTVVADSLQQLQGTRYPAGRLADGVPIEAGGATVGRLFVGSMVESRLAPADAAFLASVTGAIAAATAVAALAAILIGMLVGRRLTEPIADLTRAAEATARGNLDVRVRERGGGEIGRLSGAFNRMAAALRQLEDGRRRMIADSAHELRTPASLIQGTVEAMLDGVYPTDRATLEGLHEEALRLSRLVEDLGELSLLEAGKLTLDREPTDLGALAAAEVERFAATARDAGVGLGASVGPGMPAAYLDPARIRQVISNLLSNALRHTPSGGRVEVSVARADGWLLLRVDDSGTGIPEGERERVFERFYRLDGSRSTAAGGRGLGLAIAAGIVRAHGGSIRAERSPFGGARLLVELPLAGPAPTPGG
jgi:two-component system sensor histidine kinase BaeS